jgi:hypothetical protein
VFRAVFVILKEDILVASVDGPNEKITGSGVVTPIPDAFTHCTHKIKNRTPTKISNKKLFAQPRVI